ncbi:hypothetical protein OCU04_006794 [Sclerotinia nivalis]|uniref:Uncharacterized protein n=1 Tax=Sclerotinia nivalis TaxID=352851 RepID=A0A9X0DI79_9HELO|nr:hypothetical protein OCU04_006794 [Sclerotinia nivalis]
MPLRLMSRRSLNRLESPDRRIDRAKSLSQALPCTLMDNTTSGKKTNASGPTQQTCFGQYLGAKKFYNFLSIRTLLHNFPKRSVHSPIQSCILKPGTPNTV